MNLHVVKAQPKKIVVEKLHITMLIFCAISEKSVQVLRSLRKFIPFENNYIETALFFFKINVPYKDKVQYSRKVA